MKIDKKKLVYETKTDLDPLKGLSPILLNLSKTINKQQHRKCVCENVV